MRSQKLTKRNVRFISTNGSRLMSRLQASGAAALISEEMSSGPHTCAWLRLESKAPDPLDKQKYGKREKHCCRHHEIMGC